MPSIDAQSIIAAAKRMEQNIEARAVAIDRAAKIIAAQKAKIDELAAELMALKGEPVPEAEKTEGDDASESD